MLARIDPGKVVTLARSELPRPLDVLNLIDLQDERSYARYGLAVTPAMLAAGARLQWMGHHARSLAGEPQAERLMIVRYPSHRRFLAMTLNPYYLMINRFREHGVRRFEASFTDPHERPAELRGHRWLLFAHFDASTSLDEVRAAIEPQAGPLAYATREVASASFLRDRRPTDPNPLTFAQVCAFSVGEDVELGTVPDGVALQLYRRSNPRTLLAKAR